MFNSLVGNSFANLDLRNIVHKESVNDKVLYVAKSSTEKKIVPNFQLKYKQIDGKSMITVRNVVTLSLS